MYEKPEIKYKVIIKSSIKDLQHKINIEIERGWIPSGGISTAQGRQEHGSYQWTPYSPNGQGTVRVKFMQAMTRIYKQENNYGTSK